MTKSQYIGTTINTVIQALQNNTPGLTVKDLAETAPIVMTKIIPVLVRQERDFIFGRK